MSQLQTLIHKLKDWSERTPDKQALKARNASGKWQTFTWKEYWQATREVAKGLISLGMNPGDRVAIVGDNCPQWIFAQMGIMAARGIPAPIYTTNTIEQVSYILGDCGCEIAICDGADQLKKYTAAGESNHVKIKTTITFEELDAADHSLDELRTIGRRQPDADLDERIATINPRETCLLIYTSGTSGQPKGVKLCHEGMLLTGRAVRKAMRGAPFRIISYLPLSHVAEQALTNFALLELGGLATFCDDIKKIKEYLEIAKPTAFLGVPRVWEKFEAALRAKLAASPWPRSALLAWAMKTELAAFRQKSATGKESMSISRLLAKKLVIDKVKAALGFEELTLAASGAAPMSASVQEFFASLGIIICDVFGMSETSAIATMVDPERPVFGSVGKPVDGVELKIADDGEIMLRGKNITMGYWNMLEETKELFAEDNWMHTGDLGLVDARGNLRITGRKKDLIITAGGKNVAPLEMEQLMATTAGVGQAVVVGERKPYLCALVALDPEAVDELCKKLDLKAIPLGDLARSPELRSYLEKEIQEKCNAKVARYQTIKKFEIVPHEFSIEGGELTPTMKLKRNVINEKYADLIASMYR